MMTNIKYFFSIIFFLWATSFVVSQTKDTGIVDYQKVVSFMKEQLECEKYVFPKGEFPIFWWRNEARVESEIGKHPLKVLYFDSRGERVNRATNPGRYGAVISSSTANGFTIQRYVTLYCADVEFDDYSKNVPIHINALKGYGIPDGNWNLYKNTEERFSFGTLKYFPQRDPDAAIFLAGLSEMDSTSPWFDSPRLKDRQWWITMKAKLEGKSVVQNPLLVPKFIKNDKSVILKDSITGFSQYDLLKFEKIRTICQTWSEQNAIPQVTLIVHKGKIIFYEAFGTDDDGKKIPINSRMWMASITKLLTGTLMMQFVDQGIINLDYPVGRYLPEFAGLCNDKLTVRQLLNHTNGLHNTGEWASDWNVALENQIAHMLPSVNIGETFSYHRAGYALVGKMMERISGRAIPYLYQENIFQPLGMKSANSDNTYGGLYCSAIDLARLGQMLLNKGTYNGFTLFSAESFSKMLPIQIPNANRKWGVGTSAMGGNGLSDETFGHGAASGSIFRVDPKNELIIVVGKNKEGNSHREFEKALFESCAELIKNH